MSVFAALREILGILERLLTGKLDSTGSGGGLKPAEDPIGPTPTITDGPPDPPTTPCIVCAHVRNQAGSGVANVAITIKRSSQQTGPFLETVAMLMTNSDGNACSNVDTKAFYTIRISPEQPTNGPITSGSHTSLVPSPDSRGQTQLDGKTHDLTLTLPI